MSASTSSTAGPAVVPPEVKARVAALRKVFCDFNDGKVPWVLYKNGTACMLDEKHRDETKRDVLIALANKTINEAGASHPGTETGDFNVSVQEKRPIPEGLIVITMFPALFSAMVVDVLPAAPSNNAIHGLAARNRKDTDCSTQEVVFVSVDGSA